MRVSIFFFLLVGSNATGQFMQLYYESLGFKGDQRATLSSIAAILNLFVPLLWGVASDYTRRTTLMLKLACAGAALAYVPMLWTTSFSGIALILIVFGLFATAIPAL